jgi:hypothetical protein
MKDSTTRRRGVPYDRAQRKDSRYQPVRSKRAPSSDPIYDHNDVPHPDEQVVVNNMSQSLRRDITITDALDYEYKDLVPFNFKRFVGKHNTSWVISLEYVQDVMQWVYLLTRNPETYKQEKWAMTREQRVPLMKGTGAILYFAIATQTGPLFDIGKNNHGGHNCIGEMNGRGEAYKKHEEKVATQLFIALGANADIHVPLMFGGSVKTAQTSFNQGTRINLKKCVAMHYLGLSGKPSWDGRLPKYGRQSDGGTKTKRRKRKRSTSQSTRGNRSLATSERQEEMEKPNDMEIAQSENKESEDLSPVSI